MEGGRTRLFNAAELVAFARTFDLPLVWFLLPPPAAADFTLAGTERDLSFLVTLVWGRASQLDVIKERLVALRQRSGDEVGGTVVSEAAEFPPELSWHFSTTRQEALLSAVDAEANEIERMLGELGRVMERFEKFSVKTFMATHPRQVYRDISQVLIGEKVFRNVIGELDRQEPGRYDALVAAMGSPALEGPSISTTPSWSSGWERCSTGWRSNWLISAGVTDEGCSLHPLPRRFVRAGARSVEQETTPGSSGR